jgi:hypothetical protein
MAIMAAAPAAPAGAPGVGACAVSYQYVRQFGQQGPSGSFQLPWGVAVGPDGSVYGADRDTRRIEEFKPVG